MRFKTFSLVLSLLMLLMIPLPALITSVESMGLVEQVTAPFVPTSVEPVGLVEQVTMMVGTTVVVMFIAVSAKGKRQGQPTTSLFDSLHDATMTAEKRVVDGYRRAQATFYRRRVGFATRKGVNISDLTAHRLVDFACGIVSGEAYASRFRRVVANMRSMRSGIRGRPFGIWSRMFGFEAWIILIKRVAGVANTRISRMSRPFDLVVPITVVVQI